MLYGQQLGAIAKAQADAEANKIWRDDQRAFLGGSANTPPRPMGPLESAIESVQTGVMEAAAAIDMLAQRLEGVMQPEFPQPAGNAAMAQTAEAPRSLAVCRLHNLRSQLDTLTCRVNGLSARLDT